MARERRGDVRAHWLVLTHSDQVRLGLFEFEIQTRELKKSGRDVQLRPQCQGVNRSNSREVMW
jgi:hypothetical protein